MSGNYNEKMSALNLTDKEKTNSGANLNVNTGRLEDNQMIENLNQFIGQESSSKILVQLSPTPKDGSIPKPPEVKQGPKLTISNPIPFGQQSSITHDIQQKPQLSKSKVTVPDKKKQTSKASLNASKPSKTSLTALSKPQLQVVMSTTQPTFGVYGQNQNQDLVQALPNSSSIKGLSIVNIMPPQGNLMNKKMQKRIENVINN